MVSAALVVLPACDSLTQPEPPPSCAPTEIDPIPRASAGPRTPGEGTDRSILVDYRGGLRYRNWTGTNWGPTLDMPVIPQEARWVVARNCPGLGCDQTACGIIDTNRDAFVLLYNGTTWGAPLPIATNVTSDDRIRALDMAYLSSGRLLITYWTRNRGSLAIALVTAEVLPPSRFWKSPGPATPASSRYMQAPGAIKRFYWPLTAIKISTSSHGQEPVGGPSRL